MPSGVVGGTLGTVAGTFGIIGVGNPPTPVFVSDDFNRANSSDLGSDWTEVSGGWAIASNRLTTDSTTNQHLIHATPMTNGDHYIQADFIQGTQAGLLVRYTDASNYIMGRIDTSFSRAEIFARVGGSFTSLATKTTFTHPATLRLEAEGTAIRLYIDGNLEVSTTDSTVPHGTRVGFRANSTLVAIIDNFEAGDL